MPELQEKDYDSIKTTKKGKLVASANVKKHVAFWEKYREKLSNMKVLDPACGSGAFLNQVFDYLYAEGQKVNQELSRLMCGRVFLRPPLATEGVLSLQNNEGMVPRVSFLEF
mgnify:CR=1 FL=1